MLGFMAKTLGHLRWENRVNSPLMNSFLLTGKTMLFVVGKATNRYQIKVLIYEYRLAGVDSEEGKELTKEPPFNYHVFKRDTMAKYPT